MVTVPTVEQFETLNAKVDQVLELVMALTSTYAEESAGVSRNFQRLRQDFEQFREETRQRFDELDAKMDALTQAHGELRQAFDCHDEHTRS